MEQISQSPSTSQLRVTIWETIAIATAGVFLIAIGLAGLMYKFFSNAANPQRATQIAQSLMDYQIPGKANGVFGANLGGAKVAIVSNTSFPQNAASLSASQMATLAGVELFIARVPLDVESAEITSSDPADSLASPSDPYSLFTSPDLSFSYRSGEDFQVTTTRIEDLQFCNSMVPVRIQAGQLMLAENLEAIHAVKYDAIAIFDNSKRQVTLTAIGKNAEEQAAQVFSSLRCK